MSTTEGGIKKHQHNLSSLAYYREEFMRTKRYIPPKLYRLCMAQEGQRGVK